MPTLTSRERFALTMAHRSPDRPPIDIGATSLTGMHPALAQRLRELLSLPDHEAILRWAGTDFRAVGGIQNLRSPHTRTASPTRVVNCWGIQSDLVDGQWQITGHPLREASRADLARFAWPDPELDEARLAELHARAATLRQEGRWVVVGEHPVLGVLELGCWMCGYDDFMLKLAAEPDFVRDFNDRILAIQLRVIEQYYAALGGLIDLTMSGDDFGAQNGPLVSPAMFGELVAPWFRERIARTKALANCYYWHHSCGSVFALLDQLLACGVEILNPIQTSAAGMDPISLKRAVGDRLVFWGAVDVQQFLREATPEQVAAGVRELVAVLGQDGGYVIAPAHVMQADIPAENVIAWVEAMR